MTYQKDDLIRHIRALGIENTDTVMVHTSLKSIGEIDPGDTTTAEVFMEALRECLPEGLLLIPTHTWATIREDGQEFSVTDSQPCIGAVPSAAVKLAAAGEGLRSLHPTHSVVAFGKCAAEYIAADAQACTPAPWSGSFGKLYESGGKILLVGVDQGRNTFFHAVDEFLNIPDRLTEQPVQLTVRDRDGNVTARRLYRHKRSMSDYYMNYEPALVHMGAVRFGKIGDAVVRVCDARLCADTVAKLWSKADHDLCQGYEQLTLE